MNHYQLSSLDSRVTVFPFFGHEPVQKQCEIMGGGSLWCSAWLWRRVSHLQPDKSLKRADIQLFRGEQWVQPVPSQTVSSRQTDPTSCHFYVVATIPCKNYGLKLNKPGINEQITMANGAVATDDDVKWMYLYVHKTFNSVAFKYMLAF